MKILKIQPLDTVTFIGRTNVTWHFFLKIIELAPGAMNKSVLLTGNTMFTKQSYFTSINFIK